MKQIRKHIFESNSSSVHTLSISKDGLEPSQFKLNKDGNIEIEFSEFGKNHMIYNTQYEKLQYLMSFIAYSYGYYYDYDLEDMYNNYDFCTVRDAVCKYAGANNIVVVGETHAYIDHQSADECVINLWNPDEIINFVFNKFVALETDCD